MIFEHIQQRQQLNLRQRSTIRTHDQEIELLRQDIQAYRNIGADKSSTLKEEFRNASDKASKTQKPRKYKGKDRGYEPEI